MKAVHVMLTSVLLALSATTAFAGDIEIKAPWVRGTVAGQTATGAFMEITSKSGARRHLAEAAGRRGQPGGRCDRGPRNEDG